MIILIYEEMVKQIADTNNIYIDSILIPLIFIIQCQ